MPDPTIGPIVNRTSFRASAIVLYWLCSSLCYEVLDGRATRTRK
jgi:hypothetical protein